MVQRARGEAAGEQAMGTKVAKRRRPGGDAAIMVIKRQMLRCNRSKEQGRFKRGYLAAAGDRGAAAVFYLACLVCTAPSCLSASSRGGIPISLSGWEELVADLGLLKKAELLSRSTSKHAAVVSIAGKADLSKTASKQEENADVVAGIGSEVASEEERARQGCHGQRRRRTRPRCVTSRDESVVAPQGHTLRPRRSARRRVSGCSRSGSPLQPVSRGAGAGAAHRRGLPSM
ncbi:hypothetical protein ACP4OV_018589 [Aristida adscensionis]